MVLTYLHVLDPEIPIEMMGSRLERPVVLQVNSSRLIPDCVTYGASISACPLDLHSVVLGRFKME